MRAVDDTTKKRAGFSLTVALERRVAWPLQINESARRCINSSKTEEEWSEGCATHDDTTKKRESASSLDNGSGPCRVASSDQRNSEAL